MSARDSKGISLGKWIEEQCAALGEGLVGQRLQVYWPCDDVFYPGSVVKYEGEQGATKMVCYHMIQ